MTIPALDALPWFLPGSMASVVVGFLARRRVGPALGSGQLLGWALIVSLGIVLAATLTPLNGAALESGGRVAGCDFSRIGLPSAEDVASLGDTTLNILLLVPLGLCLGLLPRSTRKAILIAGAVVLPVVIETTQLLAVPIGRACQSADVVDNVGGLLIGLAVGAAAGRLRSISGDSDRPRR